MIIELNLSFTSSKNKRQYIYFNLDRFRFLKEISNNLESYSLLVGNNLSIDLTERQYDSLQIVMSDFLCLELNVVDDKLDQVRFNKK